jgi:hypothetical protein
MPVTVSPNPSRGAFSAAPPEGAVGLLVVDVHGRTVTAPNDMTTAARYVTIDLGGQMPGLYAVRWIGANGTIVGISKLLLQK